MNKFKSDYGYIDYNKWSFKSQILYTNLNGVLRNLPFKSSYFFNGYVEIEERQMHVKVDRRVRSGHGNCSFTCSRKLPSHICQLTITQLCKYCKCIILQTLTSHNLTIILATLIILLYIKRYICMDHLPGLVIWISSSVVLKIN